jgi:hypothetical protein
VLGWGEARERSIMVGVDLAPMRDAMERGAGV